MIMPRKNKAGFEQKEATIKLRELICSIPDVAD